MKRRQFVTGLALAGASTWVVGPTLWFKSKPIVPEGFLKLSGWKEGFTDDSENIHLTMSCQGLWCGVVSYEGDARTIAHFYVNATLPIDASESEKAKKVVRIRSEAARVMREYENKERLPFITSAGDLYDYDRIDWVTYEKGNKLYVERIANQRPVLYDDRKYSLDDRNNPQFSPKPRFWLADMWPEVQGDLCLGESFLPA